MGDDNCDPHYGARVHAQGTDCGGTTGATIGSSMSSSSPITVGQALSLSSQTQGKLNASQLKIRKNVIAKLEKWIKKRPPGGFLGKHGYQVPGVKGGIRYDCDCFGDGPSLKS
jgi:hypothetical protein